MKKMSVVIKEKQETVNRKFWIWNWTDNTLTKTITYQGKVVKVKQRWIDGGFHSIKSGCFLILEENNKHQEIECVRLSKNGVCSLFLGKKIKIVQYFDSSKGMEQKYELDGLMKISMEDVEIL